MDVPTSVYDTSAPGMATADLPNPRSDTDENDHVLYAVLGIVRPLAGKYLVFGFYSLLPVNDFLDEKGFFPDEREQYFSNKLSFEQLGDRLSATSFAFALGSQLNDWLAIGAGIDIAVVTQSNMAVYMPDAGNQQNVMLDPDIRTNSKFKPYLGALYHPSPRVAVTATLAPGHQQRHQRREPGADAELHQPVPGWTQLHSPGLHAHPGQRTGAPGARCQFGQPAISEDGRTAWEVGLVAVGERWSQYRDRHGECPPDPWHDTVTVVAGGNFAWRQRRLSFDLGYAPTPVPDQTGRTNYVDNSRIISSASIESPVKLLGRDMEAGFYLYGSVFIPRSVDKDLNAAHPVIDEFPDGSINIRTGLPEASAAGLQTNNPGYPGFDSHGYMLGAGVCLRIARLNGRYNPSSVPSLARTQSQSTTPASASSDTLTMTKLLLHAAGSALETESA